MNTAPEVVEAPTPPVAPLRRRRWKRWLLAFTLGPLALLVLLVVTLPWWLTGERLREQLVRALTEQLGVQVTLGSLQYHPFTELVLENLVLGPPEGFERNLLEVKRIAIRYDLSSIWSKELTIEEIAIESPHLVMETKNGRTNLDAVLQRFPKSDAPPEPTEPPQPLSGPLSPVAVTLKDIHLGGLRAELVGEGPNLDFGEAWLRLQGKLDSQRLDLRTVFTLEPRKTASGPLLVSATILGEGQPTVVRSSIDTKIELIVAAAASDGLKLERITLDADLLGDVDVTLGGPTAKALPRLPLRFSMRSAIEPPEDRATVQRFEWSVLGETLLDAGLTVDGLYGVARDAMGPLGAKALEDFGLIEKRPGVITLQLRSFRLSLEPLMPVIQPFAPTLRLTGELAAASKIESRYSDLLLRKPKFVGAELFFRELSVRDGPLQVTRVDGLVRLDHLAAGGYQVQGSLDLGKIAQGAQRVGSGRVGLQGTLAALDYPTPGALNLRLDVGLEGVEAPGARVMHTELSALLSGTDVFADQPPEPVRVELNARVKGVAATGIEVTSAQLGVVASPSRLLLPTEQPIPLDARLGVAHFADASGNSADALELGLNGTLGDPRAPPYDARLKLQLAAKQAGSAAASVEKLHAAMNFDALRITKHVVQGFPGPTPSALPAKVAMKLDLDADAVVLPGQGEAAGRPKDFRSGLAMGLDLSADLLSARAELGRFSFALEKMLVLQGKGRFADIYAKEPRFDLRFELPTFELGPLVARTPASFLGGMPDLVASGRMRAFVAARGRAPRSGEPFDVLRIPYKVELQLNLEDIGATSDLGSLLVEDLDGSLEQQLNAARTKTNLNVTLARAHSGQGDQRVEIEALQFVADLGLEDEVWGVDGALGAGSLKSGNRAPLAGAEVVLAARYPSRGEVRLERFDVRLPGVDMAAKGKLGRGLYGMLIPELTFKGSFQMEPLRPFVSALESASGKVALEFSLTPLDQRHLDLQTLMIMEGFSYAPSEAMRIKNGFGKLPLAQRLRLSVPRFDAVVAAARGQLGDDLEARLAELSARMGGVRALFGNVDILLEPIRTADYGLLQPYRTPTRGADLTFESMTYGKTTLTDVYLEGQWDSGLFRVDRFQAGLWDGDVLGDLVVQITPDLNLRSRIRSTVTNLNLDLPYALAWNIPPVQKEEEKALYRTSGTVDLEFALKERLVNARMQFAPFGKSLLGRMLGTLAAPAETATVTVAGDVQKTRQPPDENDTAAANLRYSTLLGVKLLGIRLTIAQNLLTISYDWDRDYLPFQYQKAASGGFLKRAWETFAETALDSVSFPARWPLSEFFLVPSLKIDSVGIGGSLDSTLAGLDLERSLLVLQPYVGTLKVDHAETAER